MTIISIPMGGLGISINPSGQVPPPITISGLSFLPNGGSSTVNCTALSIDFQVFGSGIYGNISITDVDFGVGMGSSFQTSLMLTNAGQSVIRGLQVHTSNGSAAAGSTGVALVNCTDVRFEDPSITNVDIGFALLDSNSQGLHITGAVIVCNTGITTELSGNNPAAINILGLYISNSEINCFVSPAILYLVDTGWISNTHFGIAHSGSGLISGGGVWMSKCAILKLQLHWSV